MKRLPISFGDIYGGPVEVAGPHLLISIQTVTFLFHIRFLVYVRNYKIAGKYPTEGRKNIEKLTGQCVQNQKKIDFSSGCT